MGSAVLAGLAQGAWVLRLHSGLMEAWISVADISVGLTLMAVTGMIRVFNISDGFNRLAGAVAIRMLRAYPVFETLLTSCRRNVVHTRQPGLPDGACLHRLAYKQLLHWQVGLPLPRPQTRCNAPSSPYLWLITTMGVLSAVLVWNLPVPPTIGALCFAALYIFGYARLARFGPPRWLIVRRGRASGHE